MIRVPAYRMTSLLYDSLVGVYAHQQWRENIERLEKRFALDLSRVADVACGTGLAAHYLAERGCEVLAVDISPDMLQVAARRLAGRKNVLLMRQDMRYLQLPVKVSTLVCATDSLNHLLRERDVRQVLVSFRRALTRGGHLLLDMNTAWQLREGRDEDDWVFDVDEWRLRWRCEWDEERMTATVTMVLQSTRSGDAERWVEVHRERAYPLEWTAHCLREAGFRRVEVLDAAGLGKPGERTRRLQYVACA